MMRSETTCYAVDLELEHGPGLVDHYRLGFLDGTPSPEVFYSREALDKAVLEINSTWKVRSAQYYKMRVKTTAVPIGTVSI